MPATKSPVSKKKFKTINEYVSSLEGKTKSHYKELMKIIKNEVPGAEGTISYNIGAFCYKDRVLIYLGGWKEHVSLYPKSKAMEEAIPVLANYEGNKGTIRFPLDKPLPAALIRRITKFRLKELTK